MDQFDRAQELELAERQHAIARKQEYARASGVSFTHCQSCDEPIPEKRRQTIIGVTRCVSCQEDFEKLNERKANGI